MAKKTTYSEVELEFAEKQLASWKAYVEANPIEELKDRIHWKETKSGGAIPMVTASIEAQGKFLQETMKNYLLLLREVESMREKEAEKKISARGTAELTPTEEGLI